MMWGKGKLKSERKGGKFKKWHGKELKRKSDVEKNIKNR